MWPNPQETADLVTFTEESLNEKVHFLFSVKCAWTLVNLTSQSWNEMSLPCWFPMFGPDVDLRLLQHPDGAFCDNS